MTVASTLWFGAALLSGLFAAAYAHELTHCLAVWLVGGRVRDIDVLRFTVEWEVPDATPRWQIRCIGLAPLLVGLATALPAAVIVMRVGLRPGSVLLLAWAIYTLNGGVEDFSLSTAVAA